MILIFIYHFNAMQNMQPLKQPLSEALLSQVESTTIAQSITKDSSETPIKTQNFVLEVVKS